MHEFLYECDELGLALKCFFEYEPAEVGSIEPMSGLKLGGYTVVGWGGRGDRGPRVKKG